MKKSQLRKIIRESIKQLMNEQQTGTNACCDSNAINYNATCDPNPTCTCQPNYCETASMVCPQIVSPQFANNMQSLGCNGLQQRHTHLSNKLGVVSTPGASLPGTRTWNSYDFSGDNIGPGVQGTTHSNWQTPLQNKIQCIVFYLQQAGC